MKNVMTESLPSLRPSQGQPSPALIAALYALMGVLWMLLNNHLLVKLLGDTVTLGRALLLDDAFDLAYILGSAGGLYLLIRRSSAVLRAKHAELQAIIEGTPDAVFLKDAEGRYRLINSAGARHLGKAVEEVIGRKDLELLPADTAQRLWAIDRRVLASGKVRTAEETLTVASGVARIYSTTKAPYRDAQGRPRGVIGIARDITARKRAEAALRESEARYRTLIENAPVCIHEIDRGGCLLAMNPAGLRMLGATAEREIAGMAYLDVVAPGDRERIAELMRRAFEGQASEFEFTAAGDGEARVFASSFVPLRDGDECVIKLMGCTQDITARRQAEAALQQAHAELERRVLERTAALTVANAALQREIAERERTAAALRESEGRFRQLAEHIREVFWIWSAEGGGRVLYVSPAYEAIWGRSCESLYEQPTNWMEAVHPEDRARISAAYARMAATGAFDEEYRLLQPDGSLRWIWARGFPVRDKEGHLYRIAGIAEDITERKRVVLELLARARQQAAVAELGHRALADPHLSTLLTEAVALVAQTLEVDYCKVLELLPDGEALLLRAGVGWKEGIVGQATVAAGSDSQAVYTLLSQGPVIVEDLGTETRFHGPPLLFDHGVVSGMSVLIPGRERPFGVLGADTTRRRTFTRDDIHFLQAVAHLLAAAIERQQMEEQAHEQQAELAHLGRLSLAGEMAAGLAHELNQPLGALTTLAGACQLLLRTQPLDTEHLADAIEQIDAQSQRAGGIIRRMRGFTRKAESRRTRIDINALIQEVIHFMGAEARQQQVSVHLELTEPPPPVSADPIQIQQVLINLVRNALEAMRDMPVGARELTLQTETAGDAAIEVTVCDTGPGLTAEAAERLFHPFFTTKPQGMGLGLPISKSIIEAHGGRLWASANSTRGTTFHFTLPAIRPSSEGSPPDSHRG